MDGGRAISFVTLGTPDLPTLRSFYRSWDWTERDGGDTLTFGVWLGVHPDDLQRAFREWWAPTYPDLVLEGRLAEDVQPWGLLAKPATAVVRSPDETPYLASSTDQLTAQVLTQEWPHAEVLDALPESLR